MALPSFRELKRRRMFRVVGTYAAAAFVLVQAADILIPALGLPSWTLTVIVVGLAVGLPVVLVLGWIYDLTPKGLQRTPQDENAPPAEAVPFPTFAVLLVAALVVGLAMAAGAWIGELTGSDRVRSVAVMPFTNLSGDVERDYFVDGMTEEVINALANVVGMRVASSSSVFSYKGRNRDVRDIAKELDVQAVVEGSVRTDGDLIRVNARLVDGAGKTVWSDEFEGRRPDVFRVQETIARAIVERVRRDLIGETLYLKSSTTENVEALDLYMRGRWLWNKRTPEGLGASIHKFRDALAVDSGYARAWVGLADALMAQAQFAYVAPLSVLPMAAEASKQAMDLSPDLPEVHVTAAHVAELFRRDWQTAEMEYERAIAIAPKLGVAHSWFGDLLLARGRIDDALGEFETAKKLEPATIPILAQVAMAYHTIRDYDRAEQEYQSVLELQPDYANSVFHLGFLYMDRGEVARAVELYQKFPPGSRLIEIGLAAAEARAGRPARAQKFLQAMESAPANVYVSPLTLMLLRSELGDMDGALRDIEHFVATSGNVMFLAYSPYLRRIREDPRVREIVRGFGLKPIE